MNEPDLFNLISSIIQTDNAKFTMKDGTVYYLVYGGNSSDGEKYQARWNFTDTSDSNSLITLDTSEVDKIIIGYTVLTIK